MRRWLPIIVLLALLGAVGWVVLELEPPSPAPPGAAARQKEPVAAVPPGMTLEAHFIDVGQADATLFLCDGHAMLVDGGEPADSDLIYTYLKNLNVERLDYVVNTHPHEDHAGGLAGALHACEAGEVWSPVTEYDGGAFRAFEKAAAQQGKTPQMPALDAPYPLGGAEVTVLGPRVLDGEPNDWSIILKVTFGKTAFLLTGDAESPAEHVLLDAGVDLSATVYQVGHHGSDTSSGYAFLREVMPQYAVISSGKDNPYGHPDEAVLSRLSDAGAAVYRTDLQGDILAVSDGETVVLSTEKNETPPAPPAADETYYIGNRKSKKFHRPSCPSLPAEHNRVTFETREQAVEEGYTPCQTCKP
ncbi:MBL fold metallo-hydrolase [Agathobaculum sp.]|uniref:MBL fold metallo-hydrolase n=1 Tax=Agathobaculum sp. TaxID=2048138 RepID=UPI002A7FCB78|nr:MBL fold metallo-hydrolase [Agathobaculum sp.]MDY3618938.1 MBL fold metallo-hydrolase [Agathobaculum sp.]